VKPSVRELAVASNYLELRIFASCVFILEGRAV
jgi:hypothetical protein